MASNEFNNTLSRLRNNYRLVVMNEDTYEEVVTFRLSRLSVYIGFSTLFVLLVGLTITLIAFTPLKYYIPGYGTRESRTALQVLKLRTDSLERAVRYKDQYLEGVKKALSGNASMVLDTIPAPVPGKETSSD
ncbi:MAG: hypothetical protein WCH59_09685 [Chitinophagia bacterium]|nr:hypothetical protein [Chitinophagia bacterium]